MSFPQTQSNKRIQIYKAATNVSLLDIQSALHYHQPKGDNMIYKGNIIFIINEYAKSRIQIKAFLSKSTTKMIMNSILNFTFPQLFPNGFKSYGGTASTKRARVLTINYEPQHSRYMFQIEEGQGQITNTGGIKMVRREASVRTYIGLQNALEMAHEVLDFIRHQELISLMKDEPLYSYYILSTHTGVQNNVMNTNQIQEYYV